MFRWLLLAIVLLLLALSLLTVTRSPEWSPWQLAILAGEFGHWLAPGVIVLVASAWWFRGDQPALAGTIVALGVGAATLFLKPSFQAWRIARTLPAKLEQQFGPATPTTKAFSVGRLLLGGSPAPVIVTPLAVSPHLPMDFYRASHTGKAPLPCVIMIHGGGWDRGDRRQLPHLNHWLARQGYAVAAVSYRLAPKFIWPAQRDDLLEAIAFLKARAPELGIDPTRLVLMGRSAGGQIAQVIGFTAEDPAIRGVAGLYAPSDLIFGYVNTHENDLLKTPGLMRQFLGGDPTSARANYESASSIFHVTPRSPPTLLLHGENDALTWYRHSVRLDARLAEHRVPRVFVLMPWASHAFEYNLNGPGGQLTTFALQWFLASVTKK